MHNKNKLSRYCKILRFRRNLLPFTLLSRKAKGKKVIQLIGKRGKPLYNDINNEDKDL